jgi:hypothetical protein
VAQICTSLVTPSILESWATLSPDRLVTATWETKSEAESPYFAPLSAAISERVVTRRWATDKEVALASTNTVEMLMNDNPIPNIAVVPSSLRKLDMDIFTAGHSLLPAPSQPVL